jgi:membrane protease subunit HflK
MDLSKVCIVTNFIKSGVLDMGWNEQDDKQGKDPWGNRGNGSGNGPPDLDEIVRKMQEGFGGIFGKKTSGVGSGPGKGPSVLIIIVIILAVAVAALMDMVYFIDQQERGVVLRFGAYHETWQPGLNWRLPRPVDETIAVNVETVREFTHSATMLTQDENIVDVEVAVQWRIKDPAEYLFNVNGPVPTLRQVTESAVREVIGNSELDFVLTEGRSAITQTQLIVLQDTLDEYKAGVLISTVEMQPAKPPDQVKAAFDDAIKAREDEQRVVNEAEAYSNDIIPRARGGAARVREESNAYKATVIARAEGEASRFDQMLTEYKRAPEVTRQRLYLDAMESVLSNTSKILMDIEGGNSLMYLPIDQLIKNSDSRASLEPVPGGVLRSDSSSESSQDIRNRLDNRTRGGR